MIAQPEKKNFRWQNVAFAVLVGALVYMAIFFYRFANRERPVPGIANIAADQVRPKFNTEFEEQGRLVFLRGGRPDTLAAVRLEFALEEQEQAQGMMWRRDVRPDQAMLFVFPQEEPRSFWMKNTLVSLDLYFIAADSSILNIHKAAVPENTELHYRSEGKAQFVLETVAGFADQHGIAPGDKIRW